MLTADLVLLENLANPTHQCIDSQRFINPTKKHACAYFCLCVYTDF